MNLLKNSINFYISNNRLIFYIMVRRAVFGFMVLMLCVYIFHQFGPALYLFPGNLQSYSSETLEPQDYVLSDLPQEFLTLNTWLAAIFGIVICSVLVFLILKMHSKKSRIKKHLEIERTGQGQNLDQGKVKFSNNYASVTSITPRSVMGPPAFHEIKENRVISEPLKPKILIVEDNEDLREYLIDELKKDFCIDCATDGVEGLSMSLKEIPDLIVSDIVMPKKNGIQLCKDLKNDYRTSHIPIILLSAKNTVNDQMEGIGTGADAYLTKPFSITLLQTQIIQLIESRRKLYSRFSKEVYLDPAQSKKSELDLEFLQRINDYIIQNINNSQLNVESLAEVFHMSRSQIYRKIKTLTQMSVVEYIRSVRLKQGLKLMDTRRYTLSEIAHEIGFASPSYFTKSFRKYYGKAPSEYTKK